MSDIAIKAEHLSKHYRLGVINNGMLYKDIQSWIAKKRGKEDPHSVIGKDRFADQKTGFWALKDLNFEIKQGDRVGIIGKNGAGKSTLLKILSRITAPTEGRAKIGGKVASLLEVGTGFHNELTGRENIYLNGSILGMKKREIDRKLDEIIAFSEISQHIDTPVKRYSSGMHVRLAFAVAAYLDSDILLADEVLAVGDASFQKKALGKMNDLSTGQGRTVLFVSHNVGFLRKLCVSGILLQKGRLVHSGTIASTIDKYLDVSVEEGITENPYIENITARVNEEGIEVLCKYKPVKEIPIPCLSVNLLDSYGNTLFTANCRNREIKHDISMNKNTIRVLIKEPKLHNGEYTLSFYYGSERLDYLSLESCIKIQVTNMVSLKHPVITSNSGFVHPNWEYRYF